MRLKEKIPISNSLHKKEATLGYLFVSPWIIGFLLFGLYPIIMSLYYSLCQYDVLRIPKFIALGNYTELLFRDPHFWKSIWNTVFYTVIRTPLCIIGSLLLAVLVNNAVRGIRFFRTVYFVPSIVTGVVLSTLWLWLLNPQYGLINSLLAVFGIHGPLWLQSPQWSKPAMIMMSLWSIGGGRMLVFLAALQGIPEQLYEVIDIDGGGWWTKFIHVTVPLVSPVIFLWTVLEVIFSFQVFTEAFVMTKGGPLNSTLFYNLYLYFKAFEDYNMGYASALAWLLLIIVLLVTLFQFKIGQRMVYYESQS
jgi:multiple sugar transport system permease protein